MKMIDELRARRMIEDAYRSPWHKSRIPLKYLRLYVRAQRLFEETLEEKSLDRLTLWGFAGAGGLIVTILIVNAVRWLSGG